ncbi:MAG: 23S rRNA (pseudouridine(1915)-N(3))-methyltransferase RlmH [Paludibacteraceae bacterium]|nr:23S rRNA (pseudouridine(1915)-N(3))-methyltransferase RlmH [Paludibacteraceae bacterium]
MKATFLVVGKTTDGRIAELVEVYMRRIAHYMPFELQVVPELKNAKSMSEAQQKELEGVQILQRAGGQTEVILLDEHGQEMRSTDFAQYMQKKMSAGRDLMFVVGGPYGFSEAVYKRANGKLSLSKMTFSHQMIRLLFTEQLYRALTILKGEPYHHE